MEDLWLVFQDVRIKLPAEILQKLCASIPLRIDAGLQARVIAQYIDLI